MRHDTSVVPQRHTKFIYFLNYFLERTAYVTADYPRTVISVVVLFTVLASLKLLFVKPKDDLQSGYTPTSAQAFAELEVFRKYNDGKNPVVVVIIVTAKDGGSVARLPHLNEIMNIVDYVGTNFPVKNYTYYRMCKNFCDVNEPVRLFRNGLLLNNAKRLENNISDSSGNVSNGNAGDLIKLSFPIMQFLGRDLDLSPYFFGVEKHAPNDVDRISGTNIKYVKLVALHFRTQQPNEWTSDDTFQWERLVGNYFRNEYNNSLIRPVAFSLAYTQDEIVRAGLALLPYILFGFIMMCIFATATVSINSTYTKQFSKIKIAYSLIGCITPLMATSAALGILILLGLRPGSILCITPFLILAIGVDDAFLIISTWNRTDIEMRNGTISCNTIRERMAVVLTDIGPSITITSVTNMLAFGIGIFTTSTPEIRLLCIANSAAIFLDYAYTITLYAAVMCIGAQIEKQQQKVCKKSVAVEQKSPKPSMITTFLHIYCKYLASGFTTALIFIILVLYLTVSIKYALMAKGSLTPEKLFLADSPMIEVNQLHNKIIMPSYTFVTVFISEPGDLRNSSRRERIKDLIYHFEAIPGCKGPKFTHFWLRDYEMYLKSKGEETDENGFDDYTSFDLFKFLEWPEYESWGGFMKFDNQTNRLIAFYVTITYQGKNQSDWIQRLRMLKTWRTTAGRYKDIGASIYEEEALFTDQIESLVPTTLQTSFVILICMAVVCYIFMPDFFAVLIAISSTASICVGVFGALTFWNIDVDPVSMATIIMSIGLSVDFPAHITFHYHRTSLNPKLTSLEERLAHSFSVIGFPLLQCSFSTVFFVLILLFVPSYMSEVFTKTVVVVISLGTIHALVIVPTLLCALSKISQYFSLMTNYKFTSSTSATRKITDSSNAVQQQSRLPFHSATKFSTH